MDKELEELRQLLAEAQTSTDVHKLSEKNCVEIIAKLNQLGKIKVYHTIDGKEYLTQKQIEREIQDELLAHAGRIGLPELPAIVNIDLLLIETFTKEIMKYDPSIVLIQNNLIADYYVASMCEEVFEELNIKGHMQVGEISRKLQLPVQFILKSLQEYIARQPAANRLAAAVFSADQSRLYTQNYFDSIKAQIRGTMSGVTRPIVLNEVINKIQIEKELFSSIFEEISQEQGVKGSSKGGVFVPEIYAEAQYNTVLSYFTQNSFIELDRLAKHGFNAAQFKKRVQERTSASIYQISGALISQNLVDQVDSFVEATIKEDPVCDITEYIPTQFSAEDCRDILNMCDWFKNGNGNKIVHVVNDTFLIRRDAIENVIKIFSERAKSDVSAKLTTKRSQKASTKKGQQSKTKGGKSADTNDSGSEYENEADSDEDFKKSTKKLGAAKAKRKAKAAKQSSSATNNTNENSDDISEFLPTSNEIGHIVEQVLFGSNNQSQQNYHKSKDGDLLDDDTRESIITNLIMPKITDIYKETLQQSLAAKNPLVDVKQLHQKLETQISDLYIQISANYKGASIFEDEAIRLQLEKYLLRTRCKDLVDTIIKDQALAHGLVDTMAEGFSQQTLDNLPLQKIVKSLPKRTPLLLTELLNTLQSKDAADFFNKIETVAEQLGLYLKKLDKKREKQYITTQRQELKAKLSTCENPSDVLLISLTITYAKQKGVLLHVPGKCAQPLIQRLLSAPSSEEDRDMAVVLNKACDLVTQYLVAQAQTTDNNNAEGGSGSSSSSSVTFDKFGKLDTVLKELKQAVHENR